MVLQIRLLGAVEILVGDRGIDLGAAKQRLLLAALAVDAGRPVAAETLVDRIWDEAPPQDARSVLHTYVARLRRALGRAERDSGEPLQLIRRAGGYQLATDPGRIDLHRFRSLVDGARTAAPDDPPPRRADLLGEALDLWSSDALDGLSGDWALRTREGLLQERLGALLEWADASLGLGRHQQVLERLRAAVARHPLVEPATGRLMQALSAAGRDAEALDVYAEARLRLAEELGTEPGPQLRALHRALLQGAEIAVPHRPDPPGQDRSRPAQLPPDLHGFVGRHDELDALDRLVGASDDDPHAAGIVAIAGTAGVGKTTLAVRWAHRVAERFDDGQLYVNLRGFGPGGSALSPAQAVRGLLESLRVPMYRIPVDFDAQVGLYRSVMADRRALVVLDDARDVEQVRPLLPGAPGCLTVVTSRNRLSSLLVKEGARLLSLDVLSPAEARQLFTHRVGGARVVAEPHAAEAIVARCAGLPLALGVVAARVMTHEGFPLASLAGELSDARSGLDAFDVGAADADVRVALSSSYRALGAAAASMFRLLGLHPGPSVTTAAAASLAGVAVRRAAALLAELARAHMIVEQAPGRFVMHDLLWAYSSELSQLHDAEHRPALGRMFDHYLHTARAAALLLNPHRNSIDVPRPVPGTVQEDITGHEEAGGWLTAEHPTLLAMVRKAAGTHFERHAWQLAWAVADALDRRGHWHDLAAAQQIALDAAHRGADLVGQAHAHGGLARAHARLGMHEEAHAHLKLALDLFHESGDVLGQAYIHRGLGATFEWQGRNVDALRHDQQALDLYRRAGHRPGQASALNSIGWCYAQLGDHQQALSACQQALVLHRKMDNLHGQASTLDSLGYVYHQIGDHQRAVTCYEQALDIFRTIGDRYYEADTLTHLGDTRHATGDTTDATRAWRGALDILDALGHPDAARLTAKLASPPPIRP